MLAFVLAGVTGRFGKLALAGVAGREDEAMEGVFSLSFFRVVVVFNSANDPAVDPDRPERVVVTIGRFGGRTADPEVEECELFKVVLLCRAALARLSRGLLAQDAALGRPSLSSPFRTVVILVRVSVSFIVCLLYQFKSVRLTVEINKEVQGRTES